MMGDGVIARLSAGLCLWLVDWALSSSHGYMSVGEQKAAAAPMHNLHPYH